MLKSFYVEAQKRWIVLLNGKPKNIEIWTQQAFWGRKRSWHNEWRKFSEASKVFTAKCVQLKKDGQAKVQQKPATADADFKKVYESDVFSNDHPSLLNEVFYEIM